MNWHRVTSWKIDRFVVAVAVIVRIAELNPALGDVLAHHADRLAYTAILHALKAGTSSLIGKATS